MKLCNKSTMIKERLYDIAYINNLDSTNLLDSVDMIVKKGLELELLVEFNFMLNPTDIKKLLSRVSLRNHLQRRYEIIVNSELADCKN